MTDTTVALLGTGTMGAGMARNIVAAGLPLRVWNRTTERARPLADVGAQVCESAADAVARRYSTRRHATPRPPRFSLGSPRRAPRRSRAPHGYLPPHRPPPAAP